MKFNKSSLTILAVVGAALLAGCPAEEKKTDTTVATSAAPSAEAAATAGAAATGASEAAAGAESASKAKPEEKKADAASSASSIDAKAIFSSKCAGCHGGKGEGGMGPKLQKTTLADAAIKNRIVNGSPSKGMPAFGTSGMLKPAEVDAMVTYVKTL